MNTFLVILAFLFLWTVSSVIWFINGLGRKTYRKDRWYDYALSPPVLLIATIIGLIMGLIANLRK